MIPWLYTGILALLMAFVAFSTVRSGMLLRQWTPPFNLLLTWPDNIFRLALIGFCVLLGLRAGPGAAQLGWVADRLGVELLWGVEAGVALAVVLSVAGWLVVRRWGPEVYSDKMIQCIMPANRGEWAGVLLALLPAAAVEELLFRSLPLGGLTWLVSPWWLMWPLAVFFGALHWPQGWWGVAGTTLAALILSALFLLSGSIWPPLMAHYLMNVSQLLLAKWTGVRPTR
jgi:membrane protease YdiL (CAAX protease family)